MHVESSQTRDVTFGRLHCAASEPGGGALAGEAHDIGAVGAVVVPVVKEGVEVIVDEVVEVVFALYPHH